ncbi:vacuolar protein sorting-associated protein 26C [Geospiza fortis]|uniref:Vacuolar protein sorting-associated protein 26C n=59 Tax=Neoaves TaxID=3078114 RepID=A0A6I9ZDG6_GEOFO|nr:vacuolar protein sorting-associated protein 26C [Geospiza fortis]
MFISTDGCGVIGELSNSSNLETRSKKPYVVFGRANPKTSKPTEIQKFLNFELQDFKMRFVIPRRREGTAATPEEHPVHPSRAPIPPEHKAESLKGRGRLLKHGTRESFMTEKTSEIIQSNLRPPCQPDHGTESHEILSGVVVITSKDTVQHQGISLTMEGSVNLQLSAKNVGVFEAFCNTAKPIQIINSTIEMVKPGKLPSGKTEIPFEFPLQMKGNKVLYETYHGVFVNIQYTLRCDMRRSLLAKDLTKTCEFIVHSMSQKGKLLPSPVDFTITPETLQNVKERASLPKFLIRGHLNSTNCVTPQPLTGELVVESAEAAVKSIELQLVRVETCGCAEGYARDATEIQNIQIADGDVCRGLPIPIHMVFPRLFTCPTLETTNFKVEFEVNIVVLLHDDHLITENFPLKLCRM